MADAKLTALTNLATVTGDDLVYVVDDPAGTPASRKAAASVIATYCGTVLVSDTVYGAGWNGDTTVAPSKNAVYDKIEAIVSDTAYANSWDGVTTIAPSKNALYDRMESIGLGAVPRISSNWYILDDLVQGATNGTALTLDTIYWKPFILTKRTQITDIAARITTTQAGGNFQLAIYACSTTGRPTGSELGKTGSLSTASAANVSGTLGGTLTLEPGIYFAGINQDNSTSAFLSVPATSFNRGMLNSIGSATLANVLGGSSNSYLTSPKTFGTWGDVTSDSFTEVQSGTRAFVICGKSA